MPVDVTSMSLPDALPTEDFITPRAASLLGIHLTNPLGTWPTANDNVGSGPGSPGTNGSYWVNHDGDSSAAVTSHVIPPGGMIDNDSIPDPVVDYAATSSECDGLPYAWVPGNEGLSVRRIKRVNTATRVISELNGTIDSCDLITGDVTGPDAGDILTELRVHSCTRCANGESSAGCSEVACASGIVDSFDSASTSGQEIESATFRIQRIDLSDADNNVEACEIVRDELCFSPGACN